MEIRAFHLDVAAQLAEELEGAVPDELAAEAAEALEQAGRRALAREANVVARRLFVTRRRARAERSSAATSRRARRGA